MNRFFRRLRGALGNALVWATAWVGVSLVMWTTMIVTGFTVVPIEPWNLLLFVTLPTGISGFVTGLLFSGYLSVAHRDGSVLGLHPGKSAIAGGLVAAALPTATNLAWGLSTGVALPLAVLAWGAATPFALGAMTAGGTVWIARRSATALDAELVGELEREQEDVVAILGGAPGSPEA